MDYAPMLISAKDLEGNLIMVNKKFEVLDGPSPEEFIGKNVFDLFPKKIAEELWRNDRLVVKTDRPVEAEEKVYHKDGTLHKYNTIKFPLYDSDGKTFAVCAISPDITERKLAEAALKKKEVELQKSHKEMQSLAGKLLTAQEEERRLLARELHDDLTQRLALMAIEIGKLETQLKSLSTSFSQDIGKIKEQVINLSEDVHHISRQIHPSILDDLGLVDALKSECSNISQYEGLSVKFVTQKVNRKIPGDIALCIYRVAQHSLKNIVKHAKATEVSMSVVCDDSTICLKVEDNGIGFIPKQVKNKGGLGLVSMKERMRLIQGNLSIQSKPGKGTVIKIMASL
jgi:PAS domain S-box-containing protein